MVKLAALKSDFDFNKILVNHLYISEIHYIISTRWYVPI